MIDTYQKWPVQKATNSVIKVDFCLIVWLWTDGKCKTKLILVSVVGVKLDKQTWMESFINATITPKVSAKNGLPVFILTDCSAG